MALAHPDHRLEQVNIHTVMQKVASKRDVYNLLSQEGEAYLPKMDTASIYFLKQITRGQKDVRDPFPENVVHKEISSKSCSSPSDRGPHCGGLPEVCEEEAGPHAIST